MTSTSLTEVQRETLQLFEVSGEPRTTSEVANCLDLGRRGAYDRLDRLVDHGCLKTKKVGGNGRVWWRPPANTNAVPDWSGAAESLIDDVLGSAEVGIFVLNEDFEVAWVNDATERYFGLDRERVLGRDKRRLIDEEIKSVVDNGEAFTETVLATYDDNTYTEQFECRVIPGEDSEERWLEHRSKPIEAGAYAGGRVELYYDITDRKRSEQSHDQDRMQFESIIDAVEEYAIFMLNSDGSVRTWNRGAERIKGYTTEEILGEHFSQFYADEAREAGVPQENLAAASEHGTVQDSGWRFRADGSRFWATVTTTAIRGDDGEIDGYVKVTRDMTERRKSQQKIRHERYLLEQVQEASPVGIGIFDTEGGLRRANQQFMELLSRGDAESLDYSLGEQPPIDTEGNEIPYSERPAPRALSTGEPVTDQQMRIDDSDGRARWLSVNAKPFDGETAGIVVTTADITQLKTQAQRLERQRDDLQSELDEMFERIDDAFFSLDNDLQFNYINDQASALLETSSSELIGEYIWDAFEPVPKGRKAFKEALETQESISFEEYYEPLETWFENNVYPSENGLSVYFQDITDRKERERELERYEQLVETVWDGVYALDENDRMAIVNEAFCELVGYEREELLGEHPTLINSEEVNDDASELESEVVAGDREVGVLEIELQTSDGEIVPVETRLGPFEYEDGRTGRCGVTRDISDRKRFEETLLGLYESAQTLFDADTAEAVDEVVVEAVTDIIDLPGVAVYRYDNAADELYPAAHSVDDGFMRGGELPAVVPDDSSITGHVYVSGDVHSFADISESDYLQSNETKMRGGLFVPMGDYGVLIAGTQDENGIDDNARQLIELLVTNAETAYDRVTREVALRENERQLEQQRESVAALNNLNDVVRDITNAVIEQSTREEVEEIVCDRLAAANSYEFAWIAEVDPQTQSVTPRVEAGVDGYLEEITLSTSPDDQTGQGPAGRAVRTQEIQTTRDVLSDPDFEPWREQAIEYGYRSSAAIPISYDETLYGLVGVYADRPNAFVGEEQEVIAQLGEVVGHAIAAIERKQALMSDEITEIEFTMSDYFDTLGLDPDHDGTTTFDRAVPAGGGDFLYYGTATDGAIDSLEVLVGRLPHFEELTIIDQEGETATFEVQISDPPVMSAVASHGGYLQQVMIENGGLHMTLHLPPTVAARRIIDAVQEAYPTAELISRQQITLSDHVLPRIHESVTENLTERQRTALEMAVYSGFFEWPRDTSGEEIAESLDIASPTFHQHLRKAQRKVFESIFSAPVLS